MMIPLMTDAAADQIADGVLIADNPLDLIPQLLLNGRSDLDLDEDDDQVRRKIVNSTLATNWYPGGSRRAQAGHTGY